MALQLHGNQAVYLGIAVTTATLILGFALYSSRSSDSKGGSPPKIVGPSGKGKKGDDAAPSDKKSEPAATETTTPLVSNKRESPRDADKAVHAKIEELDKTGKQYFKEKKVRFIFWFWILLVFQFSVDLTKYLDLFIYFGSVFGSSWVFR